MSESIEREIRSKLKSLLNEMGIEDIEINLEIPRNPDHGELSTNVALLATKQAKKPPREIANQIAKNYPIDNDNVAAVEIAGPGFINFRLTPSYFHRLLKEILANPSAFGSSDDGAGERWLFEFVSANPTGPLNIVSARAASIGDTMTRVFRKRGYDAASEFYVNDGGNQVQLLGASVRARIEQIKANAETAEIPENGYHGEYVLDIARLWLEDFPGENIPADLHLGRWAAAQNRDDQEKVLHSFGVDFDRWFRESELYADSRADKVVDELASRELTYESEDALWFKASEFGDDEDRVLKKANGDYTYVVPDIAYHLDKRNRGYNVAVDLLGPDHHGYVKRMEAALAALGVPKDFLKVLLVQQVNLKRDGVEVKMSKRAGIGITLIELMNEVDVDAARFFFLLRKISSPLDFDIDLARRHTEENPVYYIQYAHARIMSILRQPQAVAPADDTDLSVLVESEEFAVLRALARYPWTLAAIVRNVEPHPLTAYLMDLAKTFHHFYAHHRVITEDVKLTAARLMLCQGVAAMLREGLAMMGVSAPERM